MAQSYNNVVTGKLKLKKGPAPVAGAPSRLTGVKRKREESDAEASSASAASASATVAVSGSASASTTTAAAAAGGAGSSAPLKAAPDGRTAAQRAHDEAMKKRERELIKKAVTKTHRQKMEQYNDLLLKAPEHNDLFRISYAGTG